MTLHVTENPQEMIAAGKALFAEHAKLYDARMTSIIYDTIEKNTHGLTVQEKEDLFYKSIYHYWVYGNSIAEYFYLGFEQKTHEEKRAFISFRERYLYINHLNKNRDAFVFANKYAAYQLLKPYYRREIIEICREEDFAVFEDFVSRHPVFVAKPSGLALAIGVHKVDATACADKKALFHQLLNEGASIAGENKWANSTSVVCEQLIDQHEDLSKLHPSSVNSIRIITIRIGDKVHIFHPWIRMGIDGSFVASGAQDGINACINVDNGIIETLGMQENCVMHEYHPQSGIRIFGYQIPEWGQLIETVTELAMRFPTIGYMGWDMVLTADKVWCVMEGNHYGGFLCQMLCQKGMKQELEELIGWKPDKEFWWEA